MTESSDPTELVDSTQSIESTQPIGPVPPMAAPPAPVARPGPSGALVAAGVIQLVIATLVGLFGILFLFVGALMGQLQDSFTGSGLTPEQTQTLARLGGVIFVVFGVIALAVAVAHLLGGIGALKRWGWARILGIVTSVIGVLLWLLVLVSNLVAATQRIPAGYLDNSGLTVEEYRRLVGAGAVVGIVFAAVALAAYTFILVVLIRRGSEFS
jgi:hypothetical protein